MSSNRRIDLNQPRPGHPRDTANERAARRKPAVSPRSAEIPDRNGQPCGFVRDTGAAYIGSTSGPQPCRPLAVTPTDQFATRGWPALDQSGRPAAAKKSPALGASQNVGRRKLRSESLARPFFGSSREAVVACSNVFQAFLREGVFHLSGARACSDSFCPPESRTAFLRFHRAGLHAWGSSPLWRICSIISRYRCVENFVASPTASKATSARTAAVTASIARPPFAPGFSRRGISPALMPCYRSRGNI